MFNKAFTSTLKTIIRSPLTWAATALLFGVALYYSLKVSGGTVDSKTFSMIWDTDPRYVITYDLYIQRILNTLLNGSLMLFSAPAFSVIIAGVVLTREWHDNLFEIERAGGVKPKHYFWGRFLAVMSFVTVLSLFTAFVAFHVYCLSRGGVSSLSWWVYFGDSTIRIIRAFFMAVFPGLMVFVTFTFFAGSILKNSTLGMVSGFGLVIFKYLSGFSFKIRLPLFFHDYLTPTPEKLYKYWTFFDTEWFYEKQYHNPFSDQQMIICICCLYLIISMCILTSFICIKKRRI